MTLSRQPFAATTWCSLRQKVKTSIQTCHLELLHMQYRCAASVLWLFVEFGGMLNLLGTLKGKSCRASSLANKKAMPCNFLYACRNPRQIPAHRNVYWRNQILQTFDVNEHHLAWTRRHSNGLSKKYESPQILPESHDIYSIYRLL